MKQILASAILALMTVPAPAFDLQGHRGARGLAPENTIPGFETALRIGVTTLELDLAMTKDGELVVSHDSYLNPEHTRGPDGEFLKAQGPAIRSLTFDELQRYDVGRIQPGTAYAARFPAQKGADGVRIPKLTDVFDLVKRNGADH
ncbi:MAG: glycerophosphodiester phosphodiesterase family protein, partial [Oceanibaculum sp.]